MSGNMESRLCLGCCGSDQFPSCGGSQRFSLQDQVGVSLAGCRTDHALDVDLVVLLLGLCLAPGPDDGAAHGLALLGLGLDLLGNGVDDCISLALQIAVETANMRRRLQLPWKQGNKFLQRDDGGQLRRDQQVVGQDLLLGRRHCLQLENRGRVNCISIRQCLIEELLVFALHAQVKIVCKKAPGIVANVVNACSRDPCSLLSH